jgi:sec-independent protein translocase protein TatC
MGENSETSADTPDDEDVRKTTPDNSDANTSTDPDDTAASDAEVTNQIDSHPSDSSDEITEDELSAVSDPEKQQEGTSEPLSTSSDSDFDSDSESVVSASSDEQVDLTTTDASGGSTVGEQPTTIAGTDGGEPTSRDVSAVDTETGPGPGPGSGATGSYAPDVDDGVVGPGPESDEEMPLADHIEEMIRRVAIVLGVAGVVTMLLYPGADLVNTAFGFELISSTEVIDFLWNKHIPGAPEIAARRPRVYGPLELLLTELKVAALGGLIVGLPVFVYETYLFMRPGLFPQERRYYLAAVPTSVVLAFIGISFAHFAVLPAIFAYFTSYTTGTAVVAFGLRETFNLILILMGYNAVIFQIPLFILLAIMMNLVTRQWLLDRRLLFWGTFLGLAFLVSPDPTGMAPIIIGATMIVLFELTLLVLGWVQSTDSPSQ